MQTRFGSHTVYCQRDTCNAKGKQLTFLHFMPPNVTCDVPAEMMVGEPHDKTTMYGHHKLAQQAFQLSHSIQSPHLYWQSSTSCMGGTKFARATCSVFIYDTVVQNVMKFAKLMVWYSRIPYHAFGFGVKYLICLIMLI